VLRQRVLTAAIGIPVALALIYLGGWWLAAATAFLTLLALREFYRIIAAAADRASAPAAPPAILSAMRLAGYLLALLIPAGATLTASPSVTHLSLAAAASLALISAIALRARLTRLTRVTRVPTPYLGLPVGGLALPGILSYLVHLRLLQGPPVVLLGLSLPTGACLLFLVFAACWATDTAAYGAGRAWGRHKLWPAVSPGKTVEGSIAGLAASAVVVAAFGRLFGLELHSALVLGLLLGVTGQLGDLAESKLKRTAGVKDSGAVLPGHGGVLDRFDSLLFNAPVAYFYLWHVLGS
jgi:phosphatidate cytidylyltransferase